MHIYTTNTMSWVYSSNALTNNNHHSHTSLKTHANMICAYTRHIYACGTISPTTRCQHNILCKSTPPFTFLIRLNMIYDAWTYKQRPNNAKLSTYTSTNNNVKVHLHLHWLVHQQLLYQVFTSTQSTNHNSNKSPHHIINKH